MQNEKKIIQKLATKHNLPLSKIEEIVSYQYKFIANIIKEGNFESVRLPYFGKFSVNKGRLKHIQKKTNGIIDNK